MNDTTSDHPFREVIAAVEEHIANGALCFQKFTCAGCGARLGIDEPNRFYTHASCDKCGHLTDLIERGCGYLLVWTNDPKLFMKSEGANK